MSKNNRPKNDNIVKENCRKGTTQWQLRNCQLDDPVTLASYPLIRRLRSSAIEGYANRTSVYGGESIEFKISLNPPGNFIIDPVTLNI